MICSTTRPAPSSSPRTRWSTGASCASTSRSAAPAPMGWSDQMADVSVVDIYTDGACSGNPGPGGWGAILRYGAVEKELCGGESGATTNNRMELTAPIRALEALTRPVAVHLYTDSSYVRNGITAWVPR